MKPKSIKVAFTLAAPAFFAGACVLSSRSAAQGGPGPGVVQLGKALFFDTSLSTPTGMSCATCHNPDAGFTNPVSGINQRLGPVPGAVVGRFGNRKPQAVSYARFSPQGPPQIDPRDNRYVGGQFWDGRARDLREQATMPLQNANEMNNTAHLLGSPEKVVYKIRYGKNSTLFKQVYGADIFSQPTARVFDLAVQAIAAWEASPEVSPFTSKYDAYLQGRASLTPEELDGLHLFTGSLSGRPGGPRAAKNAQCTTCHAISPDGTRPDIFSRFTFRNVGFPKNPANPYYTQTDKKSNPLGYNPLGFNWVDYGLGSNFYPAQGLAAGDLAHGDPLGIDGVFKTPTLRNVDKRPTFDFVKAYGHNGFFKDLKQVVHFYNTRNLTTVPGEVIDFTRPNPYLGLRGRPLWPTPEVASPKTLENPAGHRDGPGLHIGNLGLTPVEEDHIVAFLKTLSDGFFTRPPGGNAPAAP